MATVLHRARALRILPARRALTREFTASASACKKRVKSAEVPSEDEDFFGATSDDLFSSDSSASTSEGTSLSSTNSARNSSQYFDQQLAFVSERLGPNPKAKHPQIRKSAISDLLHHSSSADQLEKLTNVIEAWRADGRQVDEKVTVQIIDRYLHSKPELLIRLFADRRKYGLTIPSMEDARRILRRLVLYRPHNIVNSTDRAVKHAFAVASLGNAVTFAALLPSHGLKPATEDLTCAALLGQAYAQSLLSSTPKPSKSPESSEEGSPSEVQVENDQASKRGLSSISGSLAKLFSSSEIEQEFVADISKNRGSNHDPKVLSMRNYGFTQSRELEQKWVFDALRAVVKTLEKQDNHPYLHVLNKALQQRKDNLASPEAQAA